MKDKDPAATAFIWLGVAFVAVAGIMVLGVVLLPGAIVGAIGWGIYKYVTRPKPPVSTFELAVAAESQAYPAEGPFVEDLMLNVLARTDKGIPLKPISLPMFTAAGELYQEAHLKTADAPKTKDEVEQARYRDYLRKQMQKLQHVSALKSAIEQSFDNFIKHLPPVAFTPDVEGLKKTTSAYSIALTDLMVDKEIITDLCTPYYRPELKENYFLQKLRDQLDENMCTLSKLPYPENRTDPRLIMPVDFKGSLKEAVPAYLKGTPLAQLFAGTIPFTIPEETRFSGMWIIAPPGRGKTNLLLHQLSEDLKKPGSIILMDSKGDLINAVRDRKLEKEVVVIDPTPNLALNPLDIGGHSIELLEYVFSTLLETEMTPLQSTLFRSVLQACVEFPNATIETFREIIRDGPGRYTKEIARLEPELREFFEKEFLTETYKRTRQEIQWRMRRLLYNRVMKSMFSAPKTKLDIASLMDGEKVIIINNSKALLGDEGSEFFGRFFVALILSSAQRRSARPSSGKNPVYCYIDECHTIVHRDAKIATILDECRSQKIALILAHQRMEQITSPNVLSALANCAIRFANSDEEASQLATRLRTTPERLKSLGIGSFAAFVRDTTKEAVELKIPRMDATRWEPLTATEIDARAREFKVRYTYAPAVAPEPAAPATAEEMTDSEPRTVQPDETVHLPSPAALKPGKE